MLIIPFDGPSFIGQRAVVHTTLGLRRGIVRALGPDGLDLLIESADGRPRLRHFACEDVRVVALA